MAGPDTFDELTFEALVARQPLVHERLRDFERAVTSGPLGTRLLDLCRSTVAKLLRDESAPITDPGDLDARERACITFTEMYVIDPHAVTDEMCAAVRAHLGDDGATALTLAIALFDASSRSRLALGVT